MNKHAISIKWSDEDNSFVATIPGIKALSALGATRDEALSELRVAADAYFEALKAAGKPLRLRMPKSLHASLSNEAENENISLNTYIVSLLSERHIEKRLLNRIEDTISSFDNRPQAAYKVGESKKKYRNKKRKK
jgi:antitoxin HicB